MGAGPSAPTPPEVINVTYPGDPDLEGGYHLVLPETTIELQKGPFEQLGLTLRFIEPSGPIVLVNVKPGTPAERCNAHRFIGRWVTKIANTELTGASSENIKSAITASLDKTEVTVAFAAEDHQHNGMNVWAKSLRCRLYATTEGKWMITDKGPEAVKVNKGRLMTGHHGYGSIPINQLQWMTYEKETRTWKLVDTVRVEPETKPVAEKKAGQPAPAPPSNPVV